MTTHTYKGKEYLHLKWLVDGQCFGCAFFQTGSNCPNTDTSTNWVKECETRGGGRVKGLIWVENTPEAIAKYMAERMT